MFATIDPWSDKACRWRGRYHALSLSLRFPTIIDGPGQYITREGGVVTITEIFDSYQAAGYYSNGIPDTWNVTGRSNFYRECLLDIIRKA